MRTNLPIGLMSHFLGVCQQWSGLLCLAATVWSLSGFAQSLRAEGVDFVSDPSTGICLTHQQAWGDFGLDTAAARPGGVGTPLQIGQTTFKKGLGHHANGEIVIDLRGQYTAFRTWVGVQWQGGSKGSVIFRIAVDGKLVSQTGPMSDSDSAKQVEVPVSGARELRLIANDAGDGIGCDMANWAEACLVRDPHVPFFGAGTIALSGAATPRSSPAGNGTDAARPDPIPSLMRSSEVAGGFSLITVDQGPQVAVTEPARLFTVSVDHGEEVRLAIPVKNVVDPLRVMAEVTVFRGTQAEVELAIGGKKVVRQVAHGAAVALATEPLAPGGEAEIVAVTRGLDAETGVRWSGFRYVRGEQTSDLPLTLPKPAETLPPPVLPNLRPSIEQTLIEWDWRMQDGIGTLREPRTWAEAIQTLLQRGDRLIQNLAATGASPTELAAQWEALRGQYQNLAAVATTTDSAWESLWRSVHMVRRRIAFHNPLAKVGPLLFVKQVPSSFSHQLTQYSGRWARPGGGVFVLDAPGDSMRCRQLGTLPVGSYEHPDVSWDGRRVMFAFCETRPEVNASQTTENQFFHLFDMAADGSNLRQLTDGPYDDFAPRYLPNEELLFLSTRRGGFHRCGRGPCPVFTMAVANADGSNPQVISFHETHEWDPAVLNDGRIIYTRWDYGDRHAVH
ncbi:MAG: NPCBM/NEW2 domain-containing protein [Planctomycetota bacterium]|nr:NPCBM/NEW2 domain-containing protein [Planctomycetota bacterium]